MLAGAEDPCRSVVVGTRDIINVFFATVVGTLAWVTEIYLLRDTLRGRGWFDVPPGANRLIGLVWLAEILYPDVFKPDLKREVATFYRLFYHREPTPQQIDMLLAEPGVAPR